jgi:predicted ATP-binding protein involved in virulence
VRYNQDKNIEGLYGRNKLLHELIKFLTSKETLDKIVKLVGPNDSGRTHIGYYAINYCMDRNFFIDGALAIDCNNLKLCKEMRQDISNKIGLLSNDEDDIINEIKELNIVMMFFGCG